MVDRSIIPQHLNPELSPELGAGGRFFPEVGLSRCRGSHQPRTGGGSARSVG